MVRPVDVERDLARYYDQEAEARAARAVMPERVAARDRFIAAHATRGQRSLEVGTGTGQDASAFAAAGLRVCGVDLSYAFATHARSAGAAMVNATARTLPFRDASFDLLWSMSTLMHIPDGAIDDALRELRRVLRPGGRAAIGVWGGSDVEERLVDARYDPPRFFCRRSDERWRAMLDSQFTVDEFATWRRDGEDFSYQWAVLRAA